MLRKLAIASTFLLSELNAATCTGAAVVLEKQGRGEQHNHAIPYPLYCIRCLCYIIIMSLGGTPVLNK